MAMRKKMERERVRSVILTLRLTKEEMLRFRVAALALKTDRAKLVRQRVADLISGTSVVQALPVVTPNQAVVPAGQADASSVGSAVSTEVLATVGV